MTVGMVAKCGKCGGEFEDGTVFCEHCGERIMVGTPDGFRDDKPFYAYQWMGSTRLLSFGGWSIRWLFPQAFVVVSAVLLAASVGEEGVPVLLASLLLGSLYFLAWAALVRSYRAKGSPTDFGGGGPPAGPR
jgi:hypothetical protein